MTKADAWDIINGIITDGVNCWDVGAGENAEKYLSYITGVHEALANAIDKEAEK